MLQKRFLRLLGEISTNYSIVSRKCKILSIFNLFNYQVALFMYQRIKCNLYDDILEFDLHRHDYNSRYKHFLHIPKHHTSLFSKSFLAEGPRVWNGLSYDLTSSISLPVFKRRLLDKLSRVF